MPTVRVRLKKIAGPNAASRFAPRRGLERKAFKRDRRCQKRDLQKYVGDPNN